MGQFGSWAIEEEDVREVWYYRYGISGAAICAALLAVPSLLPGLPAVEEAIRPLQNPLAVGGALSMGLSLYLIHVYVAPLKRFVQIMWAVGLLNGLGIMLSSGEPIVSYVAHHPASILGVGFIFASLTGVAVKEGLCYGKPEAAMLAVLTPIMCLSHLAYGLEDGETPLILIPWLLAVGVFAARKYTQPVKDDIGDKSVFMYLAVPEEDREAWLQERAEKGLYIPAKDPLA